MKSKVAFVYGVRGRTGASGTPYYFARALEAFGKKADAFDEIDVVPKRIRKILLAYLRWCLQSASTRLELFWRSQACVDSSVRNIVEGENIRPYFIVWGTHVPSSILAYRRAHRDSRIIVYNDMSCHYIISHYLISPPRRVCDRMIRDEKNGYAQADLIAVFHEGVRAQIIECCDIPPEKVWVIGRGVNLEPEILDRRIIQRRSELDHKFHMMVVGNDAKRKGVYRLVEAIDSLSPEEQSRLVLTVAGPKGNQLPARPYLRPIGFIRAEQREQLADEMAASDLGVLLSEAESLPGSIWEFLALRVPVWVSKTPGITAALNGFPAIVEDLSLDTTALAARLRSFLHEPDVLASLVAHNTRSLEDLSWEGPAEFLGQYICNDRVPS